MFDQPSVYTELFTGSSVPRDRDSSFDPIIVKKGENRLTAMNSQILALYAKGMSTRDIIDPFKEMYGADISNTQRVNFY